jgi:hypothetical protein
MMSYMASAMWSHPVLSLCYIEHSSYHDVVMSGHITSVVISRSDHLGRCCTVESTSVVMCGLKLQLT